MGQDFIHRSNISVSSNKLDDSQLGILLYLHVSQSNTTVGCSIVGIFYGYKQGLPYYTRTILNAGLYAQEITTQCPIGVSLSINCSSTRK